MDTLRIEQNISILAQNHALFTWFNEEGKCLESYDLRTVGGKHS